MAVKLVERQNEREADARAWALLFDAIEEALEIDGISDHVRGQLLRCRRATARLLGERHLAPTGEKVVS